ncbi:2OG-Fe(II) oxygenase [Cognatilysobacter lacus]|uniref:Proline hydroxylase n=1 Tax=Cognatilysobacter lacus TaxID=1643323 RepID=A0A5D8YJZ2_9GAMM|nr:2OG-Fe(II) oxygenase family protein [Lysobacter lacus]TZF80514.1 proline hydroxylase [Lysobacter lacus]
MINEALDVAHWRALLGRDGRVQVRDFLQPDAAERMHHCLAHEVPWTLAVRDAAGPRIVPAGDYAAMAPDRRDELLRNAATQARAAGFRFAYDSYQMIAAYREQRDPGLLLNGVVEFLNSPPFIAFARALSGDMRIRRVGAQATRYRPGHFLLQHTDEDETESRLYAYVINLTRDWRADWGGLLHFIDSAGRVVDTRLPRWNTLTLFAVPTDHCVSLVAPWAEHDRLSITGWWRA